jgi:hypothetical protein
VNSTYAKIGSTYRNRGTSHHLRIDAVKKPFMWGSNLPQGGRRPDDVPEQKRVPHQALLHQCPQGLIVCRPINRIQPRGESALDLGRSNGVAKGAQRAIDEAQVEQKLQEADLGEMWD